MSILPNNAPRVSTGTKEYIPGFLKLSKSIRALVIVLILKPYTFCVFRRPVEPQTPLDTVFTDLLYSVHYRDYQVHMYVNVHVQS